MTDHETFREAWILAMLKAADLTPSEKVVLYVLMLSCAPRFHTARVPASALAEACRTSVRTARRALQKGERLGYIVTTDRPPGETSMRKLTLPTP